MNILTYIKTILSTKAVQAYLLVGLSIGTITHHNYHSIVKYDKQYYSEMHMVSEHLHDEASENNRRAVRRKIARKDLDRRT